MSLRSTRFFLDLLVGRAVNRTPIGPASYGWAHDRHCSRASCGRNAGSYRCGYLAHRKYKGCESWTLGESMGLCLLRPQSTLAARHESGWGRRASHGSPRARPELSQLVE